MGPDPLQQVIAPQVAAVLPIGGCWSNQTEESFNRLTNRQKYRYVYDRFFRWFGDKDLQYVRHDASTCSNELWQLARANLDGLSKLQRRTIVRHFLVIVGTPEWIMSWCSQQWPITEDEKARPPLLDCHTCLLTYNGDWGVLELGPNVPPNPTNAQLTEYVKQMPEAQNLGARFKSFAEHIAGELHVPIYCCCLEICLTTYLTQKQLRLHGHVFLRMT